MLKHTTKEYQLKDITTKIGSGATPKGGHESYKEEGIPLIRSLNIYDDGFKKSGLAYLDDAQAKKLSNVTVQENDILLNITGASVARCCVVPSDFVPARVNQHVSIIRVKPELVDSKFLSILLTSKTYKDLLLHHGESGSTRQAITKLQLEEFIVSLPPLPEQKHIVAILDEAFGNISQAVANAEKNLANARELFDSYLNEVFTRKGEGWEETKLENLCSIKHGFAFKSEYFSDCGDYILLTPGSFYESGGYRERGEKTKYYTGEIPSDFILKKGDFLFAMTEQAIGLLGSSMIVPESNLFLHNQRLGLVQLKQNIAWDNDFFHHQFNTSQFRNAVQATASGLKVRHTSPIKLGAITVSFPIEISEQKKIAATLNQIKLEVKELEDVYQRKLAALAELKQALLQKAFTGELTTTVESV